MIAINAASQEGLSPEGSFPTINITDKPSVLAFWLAIALTLTCVVKYVVFRSSKHKLHASCWQECCPKRKARFFKCERRSRRKAQDKKAVDWSCPFECAFARIHMPAPLPFRKKKRASVSRVQSERSSSVEDEPTEEPCTETGERPIGAQVQQQETEELPDLSTSSDESLMSSEELKPSMPSRKSKRRRRKRSSTEESADSIASPSLPVSPTTLIDLAMMQNWPQLLVNVKANRRQARQHDADGLYPLHWAVSGGPPLEVVRALLKAYPNATMKVDSEGSNSLHFCSHYGGSAEMAKLLLDTHPDAIRVQDKYGRSPLYHAVDKLANINVLRTLATADVTLITTACRPKNYLALEKEGKSWSYLTPLYLAWVNVLTDQRSVEICSGKVWDKARMLLDLAYSHRYGLSNKAEVPLMAAVIGMDDLLPEELAPVIIQGIPREDLLRVDPTSGKNALALVASSTKLCPGRSDQLIQLLLDACPSAAVAVDREGKTALANAAQNGKNWNAGLERLVKAYPDALGLTDKVARLTPSLLLAASLPPTMENKKCNVLLADPYSLVGVKAISLKKISLEERRKQKPEHGLAFAGAPLSEVERENEHLSSLFHLMNEDPSWIVTA